MKLALKLAIIALVFSPVANAETPSIIGEGFEKYKDKGASEALAIWTRGSALEGDTTSRLNVIGPIAQIEAAYGPMESYEILATYSPSARLRRVYAVSYHAKGPLFSYFDLFKTSTSWVVYMFNFNTKPQEILPRNLIDKVPSPPPDPTPASVTQAAGQPTRQP
jgi:hypothetical protein